MAQLGHHAQGLWLSPSSQPGLQSSPGVTGGRFSSRLSHDYWQASHPHWLVPRDKSPLPHDSSQHDNQLPLGQASKRTRVSTQEENHRILVT